MGKILLSFPFIISYTFAVGGSAHLTQRGNRDLYSADFYSILKETVDKNLDNFSIRKKRKFFKEIKAKILQEANFSNINIFPRNNLEQSLDKSVEENNDNIGTIDSAANYDDYYLAIYDNASKFYEDLKEENNE